MTNYWWDLPSSRHMRRGNLSFADGHVEHWRWAVPKVFIDYDQYVPPAEMPDYQRVQAAMKQARGRRFAGQRVLSGAGSQNRANRLFSLAPWLQPGDGSMSVRLLPLQRLPGGRAKPLKRVGRPRSFPHRADETVVVMIGGILKTRLGMPNHSLCRSGQYLTGQGRCAILSP